MCQLAVDQTSDWLMVDTWEPTQKAYQPTAVVLDHFDHEINVVRGGVDTGNGTRKPVRIALLAGADLIHTMSTPGVWSQKDLDHILGKYGVSYLEHWLHPGLMNQAANTLFSLSLWSAVAQILMKP
jgi:nicotinamide mononucleotide adenylyltransferase